MIRTLIVDDDSLVHVTLRTLIDWESCGYTVIGDCGSGAQAIEFLSENPADLLITDIKMPETDGLELMSRLKESSSMPVTIALSGYDEFELVREAFRLGAYDYLLKANINRENLTQMLNNLREKVFPNAVASSAEELSSAAFPKLEDGCYIAAVFIVEDFSQTAQRFGGNLKDRLERPMLELVRQIRRLNGRAEIYAKDPSRYELFYKVQDRSEARSAVLSAVRQIQGVWHDFMNINTSVGISGVISSSETEQAVRRCETLCKLSVLTGAGGICCQWEDGELAETYEAEALNCDGFITALCGDSPNLLDNEAGIWFSALNQLNGKSHSERILILIARLAERLQNYGISFFEIFPEQVNFPQTLKELETSRERELWLKNTLRKVQSFCSAVRQEKQKGDIQRAKEFMKDNFANPELTLKTVADYIGFSEKYFSARFTKECGCTFISYLNDLRIRRAQELLLQTNMKMYEISDAVGYANVEHFNHMFKKKLCISPKSFRQGEK